MAHAKPVAPLFSSITVDHGPRSTLSRFLLRGEQAALNCGVRLQFATMQQLLAVNAAHRSTWLPLISIFNPRLNALDDTNAFCILGTDARGDVVATQAGRLLDWRGTCFTDEAESLRLFYAGGRAGAHPGESCSVTATAGHGIAGRVLFSGAAWYRPDFRGSGLSQILPRLSRALGHARWNTNVTMTMMGELNMQRRVHVRNGYKHSDWAVQLDNGPLGAMRLAILWNDTADTLEDLARFSDGIAPEIEADIGVRGAEQRHRAVDSRKR